MIADWRVGHGLVGSNHVGTVPAFLELLDGGTRRVSLWGAGLDRRRVRKRRGREAVEGSAHGSKEIGYNRRRRRRHRDRNGRRNDHWRTNRLIVVGMLLKQGA